MWPSDGAECCFLHCVSAISELFHRAQDMNGSGLPTPPPTPLQSGRQARKAGNKGVPRSQPITGQQVSVGMGTGKQVSCRKSLAATRAMRVQLAGSDSIV